MRPPRNVTVALLVPAVAVLLLWGTAWLATPTDLLVRYLAPDVVVIESSTGGDAVLPLASEGDPGAAGLMSTDQVNRLAEIVVESSGNLPAGTAVLNRLHWSGTAWVASSEETQTYLALTRDSTFTDVDQALTALLMMGGRVIPPNGDTVTSTLEYSAYLGTRGTAFAESDGGGKFTNQITNVWPAGGPPPFLWVLSPAAFDWIDNYSGIIDPHDSLGIDDTSLAMTVERDKLTINGVPYDWAYVQLTGDRPPTTRPQDSGAPWYYVGVRYAIPATTPVIEPITP